MNIEQIPTPNAVIRVDSLSHLEISFYDDFVLFAYTPEGKLKGGNLTLRHAQVGQILAAITGCRNWQSDIPGTLPHLFVWWTTNTINLTLI
jgi:hypothetical protein